jgi:P27 family predicted phage terminase small subunit
MAGRGPIGKQPARKIDQRRRLPALRPKLEALPLVLVPAPADLPAEVVPLWTLIVDELDTRGGMPSALRGTDSLLIRCLVEACEVHRQASEVVRDTGIVVKGRFGPMPNPCLHVQRDSAATILRLCAELGLSPAARTRLGLMTVLAGSLLESMHRDMAAVVVEAIARKGAAKKGPARPRPATHGAKTVRRPRKS